MRMQDCALIDEVFTHVDDDGTTTHYNATQAMAAAPALIEAGKVEFIETDIDMDFVKFIREKRGVEQFKVDRLTEQYLNIPCLGIWMDDGSCLTIDGHHRIVRLAADGHTTYRIVVFTRQEIAPFIVTDVPPKLEDIIRRDTVGQVPMGPAFDPREWGAG